MPRHVRPAQLVLVLALTTGCASVPHEAVELSMAVEQRIAATQASHERFVAAYFGESRARIEDFIRYRWTPVFLETLVRDSQIGSLLTNPEPFDEADLARLRAEFGTSGIADPAAAVLATERALGDTERGAVILEFAEAAWVEIDAQRASMIAPLQTLEAEALDELRANYAELSAMSATVTGHLQSVQEVHEIQDDVLRRIGLQEERDRVLDRAADVNRSIGQVLRSAGKAEDVIEKIKEILEVE